MLSSLDHGDMVLSDVWIYSTFFYCMSNLLGQCEMAAVKLCLLVMFPQHFTKSLDCCQLFQFACLFLVLVLNLSLSPTCSDTLLMVQYIRL